MKSTFALSVLISGLLASVAIAAPVLKGNVMVNSEVVTVGDMFADAGMMAEEALFRAPAPGTSGLVDINAIRKAAARIGITDFDEMGIEQVRVARQAQIVDETMLTDLIAADLSGRGILMNGATVDTVFDMPFQAINAEAVDQPVYLASLRYLPGNGTFAARFIVAGVKEPVDVAGRIDLLIEAPHLAASLPSGTILTPADIEMRRVPLKFAETNGFASIDQLVGKALQRQSRAGMLLRAADVDEPIVISRNEPVTVFFRNGPLTLSVKATALNAASQGESIQVINLASKRVLVGIAVGKGTVEVTSNSMNVAGL